MRTLFWRLAHHLPWSVIRRFCDMCDEFPDDPRAIFAKMQSGEIETFRTERPRRVIGWSCQHMSMTVGGVRFVGAPSTGCGCDMEPIYDVLTTA